MKLLRQEQYIRLPSLRSKVRIPDDGIAFSGARLNIKSQTLGVFRVDQDNWIITPAPLGGVELYSDAVARFFKENRGVNNVHTLKPVRSKYV